MQQMKLGYSDSNQEKQDQNLLCYHYTIAQNPNGWVFKGNRPCIVDFHAPWCIYCKRLSPVLDELAVEYDGKIDFYKVDVDQEPLLESAFSIRTIPNLLFVPVEGTPWMKLGTIGKPQLKKMLDDLLAGIHE